MDKIKKRLADEIVSSGLSNSEIARQLGITESVVAQYKQMTKFPSVKNLAKLCIILDCSSDYILGIKDFNQ